MLYKFKIQLRHGGETRKYNYQGTFKNIQQKLTLPLCVCEALREFCGEFSRRLEEIPRTDPKNPLATPLLIIFMRCVCVRNDNLDFNNSSQSTTFGFVFPSHW